MRSPPPPHSSFSCGTLMHSVIDFLWLPHQCRAPAGECLSCVLVSFQEKPQKSKRRLMPGALRLDLCCSQLYMRLFLIVVCWWRHRHQCICIWSKMQLWNEWHESNRTCHLKFESTLVSKSVRVSLHYAAWRLDLYFHFPVLCFSFERKSLSIPRLSP